LSDSVYLTGTTNAGNFILSSYLWSFDDLSTATTVNTVKKFNTPGVQNVNYKVFANNGCIGDTTKLVTIFDSPVANFGATTTICQKDSVMLTDTSTISIGTINSWLWDFGDGKTFIANNNNPLWHHYNSPGPYTISLITSSNNGCKSDTAFRQVTVLESPIAKFGSQEIFVLVILYYSGIVPLYRLVLSLAGNGTLVTPLYQLFQITIHFITPILLLVIMLYHSLCESNNSCVSDTFRLTVFVANKPVAAISRSGTLCIDSLQSFVSSFPVSTNPVPYLVLGFW
jgi:PKD repeat protein